MTDDEIDWSAIEIQLWPQERALLLKYGYPFEPVEKQLEALATSPHIEIIKVDRFYLQKLIGDLCYSINKKTSGHIQRDLLELCDRLEYAERWGDGTLEEL